MVFTCKGCGRRLPPEERSDRPRGFRCLVDDCILNRYKAGTSIPYCVSCVTQSETECRFCEAPGCSLCLKGHTNWDIYRCKKKKKCRKRQQENIQHERGDAVSDIASNALYISSVVEKTEMANAKAELTAVMKTKTRKHYKIHYIEYRGAGLSLL
jgi:hypothetical protein